MKKSNIIAILAIFILPLVLFYFLKTPPENNFSAAIANPNMPKLLQFSTAMCHDCKKIEKEIAPLRQEYSGKIIFQKIDTAYRNPQVDKMISAYRVNVVPTLIFIDKNGKQVRKTEGYLTKNQLRAYIEETIKR